MRHAPNLQTEHEHEAMCLHRVLFVLGPNRGAGCFVFSLVGSAVQVAGRVRFTEDRPQENGMYND